MISVLIVYADTMKPTPGQTPPVVSTTSLSVSFGSSSTATWKSSITSKRNALFLAVFSNVPVERVRMHRDFGARTFLFSSSLCREMLIYFQIQLIDHGSRTGTVAIRTEEFELDNECLKASSYRRRTVKENV